MKKYILFLNTAALMVAAAMMASCGKDGPDTSGYTIYVSGQYMSDDDGYMSCYWKNSELVNVPDLATNIWDSRQIFVSNGDVYLAGAYEAVKWSYNIIPSYWKNGVRTDLDMSGFTSGAARCIKVANGKVYTAGSVGGRCCYWVNNERTVITDYPDGSSYNTITDLFVDGGDVYVCGREGFSSQACYWKNGVRMDMPESNSEATSIFVDNGKVYLAGAYNPTKTNLNDNSVACYWEDGKMVKVDENARLEKILVENGTVYMAGCDEVATYNNRGCYWIGNSKTVLGNNSRVSDMYVKGGIVFTSGYRFEQAGLKRNHYPCYWVNTKRVELPFPNADKDYKFNNHAYGIFVE